MAFLQFGARYKCSYLGFLYWNPNPSHSRTPPATFLFFSDLAERLSSAVNRARPIAATPAVIFFFFPLFFIFSLHHFGPELRRKTLPISLTCLHPPLTSGSQPPLPRAAHSADATGAAACDCPSPSPGRGKTAALLECDRHLGSPSAGFPGPRRPSQPVVAAPASRRRRLGQLQPPLTCGGRGKPVPLSLRRYRSRPHLRQPSDLQQPATDVPDLPRPSPWPRPRQPLDSCPSSSCSSAVAVVSSCQLNRAPCPSPPPHTSLAPARAVVPLVAGRSKLASAKPKIGPS